ncbi:hypothetical protein BDV30DRAFT_203024 [Aspergillus minisclerotigenes]|uniref:Uncharacterized protein n=1 Tax=Aspergillus minisclerotigenes TaxID=656917 RepID=A0A5N6JJA5_9EURO|nr:hypothetical protein BDV30DRAFT_203024 [Aspergillus minisclerotigenes]
MGNQMPRFVPNLRDLSSPKASSHNASPSISKDINPFQQAGKMAEWSKAYDSSGTTQLTACPRQLGFLRMTQVAWVQIPLLSDFLLQLLPGLSSNKESHPQNPFQHDGKVAEWSKAYDSSVKNLIMLALEQLGCLRMMKIAWVRIPPLSVVFAFPSYFLFFFCCSLDR